MPIPEEKLYRSETLNRWFAISSVLMTASILWLIYIDYQRAWRDHQDNFFVNKAALAHFDFLDATRQERKNELETARKRLADAKELADQTNAVTRAKLVEDLAKADLEFRKSYAPWSRAVQVLQVTRDTFERTRGEHGEDHRLTQEAHRKLREEEEQVEEFRKVEEKWEDEKKHLEQQLAALDTPVREADKRVRQLEEQARSAMQKDQQFRGVLTDDGILGGLPVVKAVMNAPMLDFAAPKNTPGRHQVNQLVLPDVRQRLNYLETYTTDRCTTCHIAIDDPDFSMERLAQKLERSLPGINEELLRRSLPAIAIPTPPTGKDGTVLPAGMVADHWDRLADEQQKKYFQDLSDSVNVFLKQTGRRTIKLGQPLLAHPDLELFVSVDSPHPMAKIGCTICHEGNPQETDFILAAHSPATHKQEEEWKEKYYDVVWGIPTMTFETMAHFWDRPMRLPQYTEAGCAKCHKQILDIDRFQGERAGTKINLGRQLFTSVGCINCHDEDSLLGSPRVGPDLTQIASKLKPEFVQPWVYHPQEFRPSTWMPHFFQQENNDKNSANSLDPEPVLRIETEITAISKYLFAVSKPWSPLRPPEGVKGDVSRGRNLFNQVGCLGCHSNITEHGEERITKNLMYREGLDEQTAMYRYRGMTYEQRVRYAMEHFADNPETYFEPNKVRFEPDAPYNVPVFLRFAPELSGIGSKASSEWLYSWITEPKHFFPETKMPSLRLTPDEAADITAYLITLKNSDFKQTIFPMDDSHEKMVDDLVFTLLSSQRSERRSRSTMKDEGGELTKITSALLASSLGEQPAYDLISGMSLQDKKLMYLGNKMIAHYGCYACHNISGFEKTTPPGTNLTTWAEKPVTQLDFAFYDEAFHHLRKEKEEIFGHIYQPGDKELRYESPIDDSAREQITHTHAAFAKHKMLNPRIWDREKIKAPYDKLKMPNFYFDEEQAEALTTYLLSRMPPRVNDTLTVNYKEDTEGPIAKGRALTRELNCVGCHEMEDNAPLVQQYFRRKIGNKLTFDSINAPPSLRGEGAKVQHWWLHDFLLDVEPLRPWLQIRMPSFSLTGDQATTLVSYLAALSREDAQKLASWMGPVAEYQKKAAEENKKKAKGLAADAAKSGAEGGTDWFAQEALLASAENLRRWAVERNLMRLPDVDPLKSDREKFREAHETLLKRASFMKDLYNVEYPFVEPPTPLSAEERYELGSRFFNDMGCLKCHVLGPMLPGPAKNTSDFVQMYRLDAVKGEGDSAVAVLNDKPYPVGSTIDGHKIVGASNTHYESGDVETKAIVEGPTADGGTERVQLLAASAPNLGLTHQRLRRDWVHNFMLEPQWIQPGTKMPQNFVGGLSPFQGDSKYPGSGEDHINLLVDFLYDAGTKNARAPIPKLAAPKASEEFDEESGAKKKEEFIED